ncbi:MAG: putative protein YhaP [Anaerolineales bacterium]|nr:putative protein YhaP [Anaerolineales bacterium]
MNNTLLVGLREFRQRVRTRGFILTTLGMPLMFSVIWAVTGFAGNGGSAEPPLQDLAQTEPAATTIGYVDQANLIASMPAQVPAGMFQEYPDIQSADGTLENGDISAYYIVPPNYRETGKLRRVSPRLPMATPDTQLFDWILTSNLFPREAPEQVARLRWPFNRTGPTFVNLSPEGEAGGGDGNSMLPFVVAMAVMIPLFTSGGYLLQSLTQEKSSRIMEILLVSLQPRQLLTGKLLGLGALTLVQYVGWVAIGGLAFVMTGRDAAQPLAGIHLSLGELVLVVPYALGAFTLYAALMAGVGAMAPDMESSRSWVFIISVPMLIPVYLWPSIVGSPNGALAVALSLIPFSAPIAMLMRLTSTVVPAWQIAVSMVLLAVTAVGMIWLMARLFRVQTLLSGESLAVRRVWATLRG